MAGAVGFEPSVHEIKTHGFCYQDCHNPSQLFISFSCFVCVIRKIKKTVFKKDFKK